MALTVTYNGNGSTGGAVPIDNTAYKAGDLVTVAGNDNKLVKTGATFAYWNTAADGTGTVYGWPAGGTFTIAGADVTLYAQWFVTTGLTNGGTTTHYAFSYDSALATAGLEPARTNAVIAVCESDYQIMSNWFGGTVTLPNLPVATRVANLGGGANATSNITLKPGSGSAPYLRYLIVSEVTELLMAAQNKGWFAPDHSNEQSCGEGLSRFLAQEFLVVTGNGVTQPGYAISPQWLNSSLPTSNPSSSQLGSVLTTLYAGVDTTTTTLQALSAPTIPFQSTYIVQVDSEQMLVTSVDAHANKLTVTRGYNGTSAAPHAAKANVTLNFGARADYVNVTLEYDHGIDAATGCAMLFLYYLQVQLGFSAQAIVCAAPGSGADNARRCLALVFQNLTKANNDPFPTFKQFLAEAFPPDQVSAIPGPNPDNPYPIWKAQFAIAGPGSTSAKSPVSVLARMPGQEEVFWIGAAGDISSNWRNDGVGSGAWHTQFAIARAGTVRADSPVVVLARMPAQEEVFWIGAVGDVSSNWRNDHADNGAWHTQFAVARPSSVRPGSPLAVLARMPQQEEVFWIGGDGDIGSNWRNDGVDNGAWHAQFTVAPGGSARSDSPLAVLSRMPQQEEVFWIGAGGDVGSNWRNDNVDNGAWHTPFAIARKGSVRAGSPLAVLARMPQQEEVFWIGAVGDVSSNWRNDNVDSGAWHTQFAIARPGSVRADSPLVALARTPQQEEVFWIGAAGDVSSNWRNDHVDSGAWHTQFAIAAPNSVRAGSPLVVVARTPQHEDVFWIGSDGSVWNAWRDDGLNGGLWQPARGICRPGTVRSDSALAAISRTPQILEVFWTGANGDISSTYLG